MGTVGLIGIGRLGSAIASRLIASDFEVIGWDPDESRRTWLNEAGGRSATPYEIALSCRRIVVCVPGIAAVTELTEYVRAGTIIIDAGNPTPEEAEQAASSAKGRAAAYLDAPICDWHEVVRERGGRVLVGGDESALSGARDVLAAFAREIVHAGPVGEGVRRKQAGG